MDELKLANSILDALPYPVVFADTKHVIRYMNKRARYYYYQERGYKDLIGKSIFVCHGEESRKMIEKMVEKFKQHGREIYLKVNVRNERVYVVPVRDDKGDLLGYFERFEMNLQK
jgi:DUF438 domain-containing protein